MGKIEKLNEFYEKYKEEFCNEQVVLGNGNPDSKTVFIGEAPGKDEIKYGKPFVGAAGKILTDFFDSMGLKRDDIYITNTIKYRLCKKSVKTGRPVNRPVRTDDITRNRDYLYEELVLLNPELVVTLGNSPLKALLGNARPIGDIHGECKSLMVDKIERKLFPLYHPASIIYNRSLNQVYTEDLDKLKKVMEEI